MTPALDGPDHEALAAQLEATGHYRVLRRLVPRTEFRPADGTPLRRGVILDVETTGLDTAADHVIELGMVAFDFSAETGDVYRVTDTFEGFRNPGVPIPAEVTAITGITDEMVAGHAIDPEHVAAFVADAVIMIAHNAGFDRKMAERHWPCCKPKAWACSWSEVDWKAEGFDGAKLAYLAAGFGFFHESHRAAGDCHALLEMLARSLPRSGAPALKRLLDTARVPTVRIWALNSPFDSKDQLKARGYKWNDGSDGEQKTWWRDMREPDAEAELAWLKAEIYKRELPIPTTRITAMHRHSVRA